MAEKEKMKKLRFWFRFRRVCGWCKCRLGGNPFALHDTHGICPACLRGEKLKLVKPLCHDLTDAPTQPPGFIGKHLWRILT